MVYVCHRPDSLILTSTNLPSPQPTNVNTSLSQREETSVSNLPRRPMLLSRVISVQAMTTSHRFHLRWELPSPAQSSPTHSTPTQ